ncbi:MAG TPA: DUF6600 domain-containing protein, partial [Candidatus Saccharimonadales bacterium]|nr:DUF6600 domain-containing protein [Candidatus Saccharimonadales bacterium]
AAEQPAAPVTKEKAGDPGATPAAEAPKPAANDTTTNAPAAAVTPDTLTLSPALSEVVRLVQGGVSEEVLMAYITNSADLFNLGAAEVVYLHDLGAPPTVITMLIQHDSTPEMQARKRAAAAAQPLPPGFARNTPVPGLYAGQSPPTNQMTLEAPLTPPPSLVHQVQQPTPDTAAEPPPVFEEPTSVSYFYDELAPYGTWIDVGGYGRCWRPTVAVWNSGWRPYGDCGRWIWSNCGWYWYSDYSWGWAPFHYGRWACPSGLGWVWQPDTCWGPSWVSWRYSSAYCGWAPLPPSAHFVVGHGFYNHGVSVGIGFDWGLQSCDFAFVATSRFCDPHPCNYFVSPHHASGIYKDTTVVNNYGTINKTTVVNNGVGFQRIASATKGNIRQVALKGTTDVRNLNNRREVLDADGRTLTFAQPSAGRPANAGSQSPIATAHMHQRTDRVLANAPDASTSTGSHLTQDTSRQATHLEGPDSTPARPTFLSPRSSNQLRPTSSTQPSSVAPPKATSSPNNNGASTAPATPQAPANQSVSPRNPRVEAPVIVRRGSGQADNNVPQVSPSPSNVRPNSNPNTSRAANSQGGGGRSFVQPGPVRAQSYRAPESIRPNAPAYTAPAPVRPSAPMTPRVESYRAPAPAPAPAAAPAAPAVRSAPAPARSYGGGGSVGGGHSSGRSADAGGGGVSAGGGGGRR